MGIEVTVMTPDEAAHCGWDDYVSAHPKATPYHRVGWIWAVAEAYGHQVYGLTARDRDGTLVGLLPLCLVKAPLTRGTLTSLPYCDLGGPLGDTDEVISALNNAAVELADAHGLSRVHLRLGGDEVEPESGVGKVSMLLDLPESGEALFRTYKPKLRSQIRKAEKNGLTAEVTDSPDAVAAFYQVFAGNMHRLGSPVHSLSWFQTLKSAYGERMVTGLVRHGDEVIGAGILLLNGHRASIPWASTDVAFNRLAPNMLLYWSLLEYVADRGYRVFDFGRSTPGEGTWRFKKQWGAHSHALEWISIPCGDTRPVTTEATREDRGAEAVAGRGRACAEWLWKRMPLWLANLLGPHLRKYVTL